MPKYWPRVMPSAVQNPSRGKGANIGVRREVSGARGGLAGSRVRTASRSSAIAPRMPRKQPAVQAYGRAGSPAASRTLRRRATAAGSDSQRWEREPEGSPTCRGVAMACRLPLAAAAMDSSRHEILRQIEEQHAALRVLESRLLEVTALGGDDEPVAPWPPKGFYLTFYVVAGLLLGILGSLVSFLMNVGGSLLMRQDPLLFLRVYGTVFLGPAALTTDDLTFFMLVAVVHFSVGAIAGAVFHVLVNLFVPDRAALQLALGALYGLLMWVVNFYV